MAQPKKGCNRQMKCYIRHLKKLHETMVLYNLDATDNGEDDIFAATAPMFFATTGDVFCYIHSMSFTGGRRS